MITQHELRELFDYRDDGVLVWRKRLSNRIKVGQPALNQNDLGYIRIRIHDTLYKAYRLIFLYHYGYMPQYIDHINQIKSGNRIENLRETTKSLNGLNGQPRKGQQYRGVTVTKRGRITAQIFIEGKRIYLGDFKDVNDAAQAYNFAVYQFCPDWGIYNT